MPAVFKIDKNIPVPKHGRLNYRYPFEEMEPGDSFLVEDASKGQRVANRVRASASHRGYQVTVVRVSGGWRCWMIGRRTPKPKRGAKKKAA
jgi:hypothetical protein